MTICANNSSLLACKWYDLSSNNKMDHPAVEHICRIFTSSLLYSSYSLRIRVEDGGNPKKSDMADLIINIVNVNEAPVFTGDCSSGCRVNIDEGNGIGRPVKQLFATDPDTAACRLKFSITSSDRAYFSIDQTSGMITTKSAIDRETKEVYELRVVVADCANPPLTDSATLFVNANDINDNAPRFPVAKYVANVNENQGSGTSVTRVQATG